jgi:hypothetical protein
LERNREIIFFIFENKMVFSFLYICTMDKKLSSSSVRNKNSVFVLSLTSYFVQSHNQFINQTKYNKNCLVPCLLADQTYPIIMQYIYFYCYLYGPKLNDNVCHVPPALLSYCYFTDDSLCFKISNL